MGVLVPFYWILGTYQNLVLLHFFVCVIEMKCWKGFRQNSVGILLQLFQLEFMLETKFLALDYISTWRFVLVL
jgi:hypothetical protein